jgi:BTB And C-terminal Kelch
MRNDGYYETDRPDFRQPDFEELAIALPPPLFQSLMQRDDLTCHSEAQVLSLIEKYITRRPQSDYENLKQLLIPCVRLDKLPSDRLI